MKSEKSYKEKGLDDGVVLKLLSAINRGYSKEQLGSSVELSDIELSKYVEELVKDELVGYDILDNTTLKITEKGTRFLISYERVTASKAEHQPPRGLFDLK